MRLFHPSNSLLGVLRLIFQLSPSSGYWIDIYSPLGFLGMLDIGSAGFYCGRSADGNQFAYLYQPPGSIKTELRWVDLRQIDRIARISVIHNPSAPVWSPFQNTIAVTGFLKDEKERSTFVVEINSGELQRLDEGSFLPPAWSDDGKIIYSLDERYQHLLAFNPAGELIGKWRFDPENWQATENGSALNRRTDWTKIFPSGGRLPGPLPDALIKSKSPAKDYTIIRQTALYRQIIEAYQQVKSFYR
ncbi:hypothetical protein [Bellilinea caldifistulae]|uniref:Dipeptidylpeptidase IV N-terminal domain-containing protein n=1 Tax=Bellilinea caldifistulae TaxID=360411 RepID=A0A0N8GLC8_9CHLR|nr:hypothetical protein [Bellilinea caldifistulae]KPL72138.1 hypothetical protein AC812_16285 [Bellilinea caldifistulae]